MSQHFEKKLFPIMLALPLVIVIVMLVKNRADLPAPVEPQKSVVVQDVISTPVEASHIAIVQDSTDRQQFESAVSVREEPKQYEYVQVVHGCDSNYAGTCVNARVKPNSTSKVAYKLRNGVILKVSQKLTEDGRDWYKVFFDEWLRYPDRVSKELYVAAEFVEPFLNEGSKELTASNFATSSKRIIVDRTKQILYAYDENGLYMKEKVSTGIELTPTPRGTFTIYRKTPSRYMQGPIPGVSTHYYDLPGVPWNLYFSKDGAVIHGAYWHQSFGRKWSNGCVNLPIASAEKLYKWADVGTKVIVRD